VFSTLFPTLKGFLNASLRQRIKLLGATSGTNRLSSGVAATIAPSGSIHHALTGAVPFAVRTKARLNALACLAIVALAPSADHRGQLYAAEFAAITGFVAVYLTVYRTSIFVEWNRFHPLMKPW
jgi:hypothetical protein